MVWIASFHHATRGVRAFSFSNAAFRRGRHGVPQFSGLNEATTTVAANTATANRRMPTSASNGAGSATSSRLFYTPFPENLYREWTLDQDRLLWSNRRKPPSELAVLLGRGIRGVEKRIEKLGDVESSAYQRLFVGQNQNADDDDDVDDEKVVTKGNKKKLTPSSEVMRRIEWDYQLDEGDFRVMHYDRVDNTLVTSPLTAPNESINSGETSLIKALPEHRIVAILYRERVVWDRRKNRKYDVFFGPPGILDVAESYREWKAQKDTQMEEQGRLRLIWKERWVELLHGSNTGRDRLLSLTEDLLAEDRDGYEDAKTNNNNPYQTLDEGTGTATATTTLTSDQQRRVDTYVEKTFELFRAVERVSGNSSEFQGTDDTDIGDNNNNNKMIVSLFDELSEWIASPCWSSFEYDDIGTMQGSEANLVRETLLRKLSSTMDKIEGKHGTGSKKQQKGTQKKQSNQDYHKLKQMLLNDKDIEETFVRGSGAGGQKINKTSNRVVLVHLPSGIRIECQETRSLQQNRKIGRKRLLEKLDSHYRGSDSKEQQKQQKLQTKKKKKKSKNKSRLAAKQEAKRQKKAMQAKQQQQQQEEDNYDF